MKIEKNLQFTFEEKPMPKLQLKSLVLNVPKSHNVILRK